MFTAMDSTFGNFVGRLAACHMLGAGFVCRATTTECHVIVFLRLLLRRVDMLACACTCTSGLLCTALNVGCTASDSSTHPVSWPGWMDVTGHDVRRARSNAHVLRRLAAGNAS